MEGSVVAQPEAAHPNVLEIRRELSYDGGTWRYLLVIVTDIPLDPKHPDHKATAVTDMVSTVTKQLRRDGAAGYHSMIVRNP